MGMENNSLLLRTPAFFSDLRYLNPLHVFGNGDPSDNSNITDLELRVDPNNQQNKQAFDLGANRIDRVFQNLRDKIIAALELLTFREPQVIVQFWSPRVDRGHLLLATIDQPFGLGVGDVGLWSYRRDSQHYSFLVDEDHSPAARVFRHKLPEWTFDLNSYTSKQFPQQACAIRRGLQGYLGLPVFDMTSGLCVGVIEILTSSKYTSYAYEVQQLHNALKMVDLKTHQPFDCPILNVPNERRQYDFDKIHGILKTMCDIYNLPLAQTWAVSQHSSYVSHEKVIVKSCSSFNIRCVGKDCMSRAALPFHVQDMRMWSFFKASGEQHLDRSRGLVGRALLSRGSSFCQDVTKLSEEEYPLVHNARMNGLTSCFAISLHSVEDNDYVLEFYLPPDIKDSRHVLNLVQTLKQNIQIDSGFELGDSSCIHIVEPTAEDNISSSIDPCTLQIFSTATTNNNQPLVTSDSESVAVNMAKTDSASVSNQWPSKQIYPDKITDIITSTENLVGDRHVSNVICVRENENMLSYPNVSMQNISDNITDAGEKSSSSKQGRKRKIDSLTMEAVEKLVGKPIDEAAKSLNVGRSTLKRFCREHDMPSWPLPKHSKKTIKEFNLKPSQKAQQKQNLQRPSNKRFGLAFVVNLMVRVKRWSCSSKSHGFSGKWWICGKHSSLPSKSDFIYQVARLIVQLRRWRNKISIRRALQNGDHPVGNKSMAKPKYTINNIKPYSHFTDIRMVTMKATFKDDMIKFQFPISSGLLELKNEVAQRIKLERRRLRLKYKDEDNDLISLASDDDLHFLLGFTTYNSTIRLIIIDDYF